MWSPHVLSSTPSLPLLAVGHLNILHLYCKHHPLPTQPPSIKHFWTNAVDSVLSFSLIRILGIELKLAGCRASAFACWTSSSYLSFIFFSKGKKKNPTWSPIPIAVHTPLFRKPPSVHEEVVKWARQYMDRKGRNWTEMRLKRCPPTTWYLGSASPQTHLSTLCMLLTLPHIIGREVRASTLIWIPETNPHPAGIWAALVLAIRRLGQLSSRNDKEGGDV